MRRHHLSADEKGLPVSRRHHGLVYPEGTGLADIEHAGGLLLSRGAD